MDEAMQTPMARTPALPVDNEDWFKKHIIEQLEDLKRIQEDNTKRQELMHQDNSKKIDAFTATLATHVIEDLNNFNLIKRDVSELQPARKIVYGAMGLILIAFMGALIALVIKK